MVATVIVVALLVVLAWGGLTGRGVTDSRDPRFGLSLSRWQPSPERTRRPAGPDSVPFEV